MDKTNNGFKLFNDIRDQWEIFFQNQENSDIYYEKIKNLMLRKVKFDLSLYRDRYIKGRIYHHIKSKKYISFKNYYEILKSNDLEISNLKNLLNIHTTEFFRDVTPFSYFQNYLIPKIIENKTHPAEPIRILSAPCSTGEEAYSFAIIIHFLKSQGLIPNPVEIIGIDIDKESIEKAKNGIFQRNNIKNISQLSLQRNFNTINNKLIKINDDIAKLCKFYVQDIFNPLPFEDKFDLIACRNLLIYISKTDQVQIIDSFKKYMNINGFFMLGFTEGFKLLKNENFRIESLEQHFYQYIGEIKTEKSEKHQLEQRIDQNIELDIKSIDYSENITDENNKKKLFNVDQNFLDELHKVQKLNQRIKNSKLSNDKKILTTEERNDLIINSLKIEDEEGREEFLLDDLRRLNKSSEIIDLIEKNKSLDMDEIIFKAKQIKEKDPFNNNKISQKIEELLEEKEKIKEQEKDHLIKEAKRKLNEDSFLYYANNSESANEYDVFDELELFNKDIKVSNSKLKKKKKISIKRKSTKKKTSKNVKIPIDPEDFLRLKELEKENERKKIILEAKNTIHDNIVKEFMLNEEKIEMNAIEVVSNNELLKENEISEIIRRAKLKVKKG